MTVTPRAAAKRLSLEAPERSGGLEGRRPGC